MIAGSSPRGRISIRYDPDETGGPVRRGHPPRAVRDRDHVREL